MTSVPISNLPFVIAPQQKKKLVGDEIIGQVEFPAWGYLLGGERAMIDESTFQTVMFKEAGDLANRLADGEQMERTDAHQLAVRILSSRLGIPIAMTKAELELRLKYISIVANAEASLKAHNDALRLRTITAAIVHRLPGCGHYTDAMVSAQVGTPLQDAIYAFMQEEMNHGQPVQTAEEAIEQVADQLGKFSPEPGGQNPSIGEGSTGDAGPSGPMTRRSAVKASPSSPGRTSSRQSTRASAASGKSGT